MPLKFIKPNLAQLVQKWMERATRFFALRQLVKHWLIILAGRGVQRSGDARDKTWLYAPPTNIQYWGLREIQAQQTYIPKPLPRAKGLRHKAFASCDKKEEKKVNESLSCHATQ